MVLQLKLIRLFLTEQVSASLRFFFCASVFTNILIPITFFSSVVWYVLLSREVLMLRAYWCTKRFRSLPIQTVTLSDCV